MLKGYERIYHNEVSHLALPTSAQVSSCDLSVAMKNIIQSSINCMFHKCIKYIKTLYTDEQQVIVPYMTISQLNNPLCFKKKGNHRKTKIRTFE